MSEQLKQVSQPPQGPLHWFILTVANLLCLIVAGMYVWTTHDLLGFILLYGIATGAINARDVIRIMYQRQAEDYDRKDEHDQ